jgi:phosphopantothenoylcysteine decarboxylase / phosphopantothenate---cysteine ligase
MLTGKKIILGITGGIAAYKCPHLVRLLVREGAEVRVVMTPAAEDFVTARTLGVVSRQPVWTSFFDADHKWNNHVHLAQWADLMLVAPLTANTLAKMASGQCDNVLLAVYLSLKAKCIVAPAMDLEMYQHASVKQNLERFHAHGGIIIPATSGELASGLYGEGRMAEPEVILEFLKEHFSGALTLKGVRALVNAGPTHEAIDPVRFIGNGSSGRMGVAIAEELAERGAKVTLVLGPGSVEPQRGGIAVHKVITSDQMYSKMLQQVQDKDVVICSAAVADYKPAKTSERKIKKKSDAMSLDLVKTKDVLAELGSSRGMKVLVGFALETEDLIENATAKLKSKHLDLVVANPAAEPGSGIGAGKNRITLIDKHNKIANFELMSKRDAAKAIVDAVTDLLRSK